MMCFRVRSRCVGTGFPTGPPKKHGRNAPSVAIKELLLLRPQAFNRSAKKAGYMSLFVAAALRILLAANIHTLVPVGIERNGEAPNPGHQYRVEEHDRFQMG